MAAAVVWAGGCGDPLPPDEPQDLERENAPATVTVSPATTSVAAEDTVILKATVYNASGGMLDRDVTWSSSDPAMATVVSFGPAEAGHDSAAVIGAKAGTVTITATSGAASGTSAVTVGPPRAGRGIVSDPVARVAAASGSPAIASADEEFVFVSLPPDSFPDGEWAVISNTRTGSTITTSLVDGGLDPVSLAASAGDAVFLDVRRGTETLAHLALVVPVVSKPRVVRVYPPRKKRDVVLNARPLIIFSEPIDGATLTSASIQLLQGTTPVAGTAQFLHPSLDASLVSVEFVPDAVLAAGTEYQLIVTREVRDLDGAALAAADTVPFTAGQGLAGPPASIQTSPDSLLSLVRGETYQLTATVRDAAGNVLTGEPVTWSSSDAGGLSVSPTGLLTALRSGFYFVTATVGTLRDMLTVSISPAMGPPASLTVFPSSATLLPQTNVWLGADIQDAGGNYLSGYEITWRSADPGVATVDPSGMVTAISQGSAKLIASGAGFSDTSAITVTATIRFQATSVADGSSCGITTGGAAYCWGAFVGYPRGQAWGQAGAQNGPLALPGAITLAKLDGHSDHACGITAGGAAYCWGANDYGQLGNGGGGGSETPVAVSGAHSFAIVSAGDRSTCGVTTDGAAYCWGLNSAGQLGNGTSTGGAPIGQPTPVAVVGGLSFATVSIGWAHTCGITTAGAAYCWGSNGIGQLGDGTTTSSPRPVAVQGGLTFATVSVGEGHTCGISTAGAAYCWGSNGNGQLGDGTTTSSPRPVAMQGGPTFATLSAGRSYTCGVTSGGAAYCWGANDHGQLGDGTRIGREIPGQVQGGLTFATISSGLLHTCGVTTASLAYCWGWNKEYGQLGDGTKVDSDVPVKVLGQP